jgi:ABC-type polar amino acid transport system ATPase subunit
MDSTAAHVIPANAEEIIHIDGLNKWFGDFQVLRNISLSVRRGGRIVICGPSGSGDN